MDWLPFLAFPTRSGQPPTLFLTMPDGVELAVEIARFADDKQAEDIVVLDLQGISTITDFFVICTGTSLPHLKAVRREIVQRSGDTLKQKPSAADGTVESLWLVLDFGDVIVHIFHKDKRGVYALEDLWSDAPRVEWNAEADVAAGVAVAATQEG